MKRDQLVKLIHDSISAHILSRLEAGEAVSSLGPVTFGDIAILSEHLAQILTDDEDAQAAIIGAFLPLPEHGNFND